jgi:hypothetical protein
MLILAKKREASEHDNADGDSSSPNSTVTVNHTNFKDLDGALTFGLVQVNPNPGTTCSLTNVCKAEYQQTNTRFGAPVDARSPRVQQASIRINF